MADPKLQLGGGGSKITRGMYKIQRGFPTKNLSNTLFWKKCFTPLDSPIVFIDLFFSDTASSYSQIYITIIIFAGSVFFLTFVDYENSEYRIFTVRTKKCHSKIIHTNLDISMVRSSLDEAEISSSKPKS